MVNKWFIQLGDKLVGPLSDDGLKRHIWKGQVLPGTQVRRDDDDFWVAASNIPGLFDSHDKFGPPTPAPATARNDSPSTAPVPDPHASAVWYARLGDKEVGPLSLAGMKRYVIAGQIQAETPVRPTDGEFWVTAASVPGLMAAATES